MRWHLLSNSFLFALLPTELNGYFIHKIELFIHVFVWNTALRTYCRFIAITNIHEQLWNEVTQYGASDESRRLSAFNEQQNPMLFRKSDIGLLKHLDIRKIIILHWMSILTSSFKLFSWTKQSSEHISMLSEPIALSILSSRLWNCMKLIYFFWKILTIQFLQ